MKLALLDLIEPIVVAMLAAMKASKRLPLVANTNFLKRDFLGRADGQNQKHCCTVLMCHMAHSMAYHCLNFSLEGFTMLLLTHESCSVRDNVCALLERLWWLGFLAGICCSSAVGSDADHILLVTTVR